MKTVASSPEVTLPATMAASPHIASKRVSFKPRNTESPPTIGEHNREIYLEELGLSEERLAELESSGVV